MSDAIGSISTLAGVAPRTDDARPRDARATDPTQASFATLLGAALAPAARPLTRPAAAGAEGSASERSTEADPEAGANGTIGGAPVTASGPIGAIVAVGGGPAAAHDAGAAPATAVGAARELTDDGTTGGPVREADAASREAASREAASRDAAPSTVPMTEVTAAAHGIYRGTDALAPELRTRLGRVVARMRTEHGHEVRVTETFRSQARQDHLHAQGRTAAGPVVTWTRQSNHTLGRAADVVVNGTYDDPAAYATLQRIAREEGLHTLGPRDPGHLELPKSVGGRVDLAELARLGETAGLDGLRIESLYVEGDDAFVATPARAARGGDVAAPATGAHPARVAAVANVAPAAQVATVAVVAQVAQVAQVATPGMRRATPATRAGAPGGDATVARAARTGTMMDVGGGPAARRAAPFAGATHAAGGTVAGATSATVAAGEARTAHVGAAAARAGRGERERAEAGAPAEAATASGDSAYGAATHARTDGTGVGAATIDPASRVAHVETVEHLARLDRIEALRESAAQRPLSHLTLTLDNAAGGADRIRVGMRGTSVGATLELSDAAQAERMTARLGELQQALESRGLDPEALQVRRAGVSTEPAEVARVAATVLEREALRSGASSSAQSQSQSQQQQNPQSHATTQREREERAARDGSQHEDPSSSRHRSRREHEEHTR